MVVRVGRRRAAVRADARTRVAAGDVAVGSGAWTAVHHAFTSPKPESLDTFDTDPGAALAYAYDIVCNGNEIGGGSIRIHRRDVQERVFAVMGLDRGGGAGEVRLPARRVQLRRAAARRHRVRLGPHLRAAVRHRLDPRRHRLPEDRRRLRPAHRRAGADHARAAQGGRHRRVPGGQPIGTPSQSARRRSPVEQRGPYRLGRAKSRASAWLAARSRSATAAPSPRDRGAGTCRRAVRAAAPRSAATPSCGASTESSAHSTVPLKPITLPGRELGAPRRSCPRAVKTSSSMPRSATTNRSPGAGSQRRPPSRSRRASATEITVHVSSATRARLRRGRTVLRAGRRDPVRAGRADAPTEPRRRSIRRRRSPSGCARARSTRSSARTPARAGLAAAPPGRGRRADVADPVRAARHRQDHAGADRVAARPTAASSSCRRSTPGVKDVREVIERAKAELEPQRPADRAVHRRDPPLLQDPAGLAARRGRGPARHAGRGDHREPVLLDRLAAALAQPAAHPAAAGRGRRSASWSTARCADERGLGGAVTLDDDARAHLLRMSGGDARRALTALEAAAGTAAAPRDAPPIDLADPRAGGRHRRGALRPRRRPALRRDQRVHQVDPRLGRRRRAALPGPDDRGGRGPAVHRPPAGRARRPRTSGWPTRPRCSRPPRPPRPSQLIGMPEARINLAQATIHLALAPKSNAVVTRDRRGARPTCGPGWPAPCRRRCATGTTRARRSSGTRSATSTRTTCPTASPRSSTRRTSWSAATTTSPASAAPSGTWPSGWPSCGR